MLSALYTSLRRLPSSQAGLRLLTSTTAAAAEPSTAPDENAGTEPKVDKLYRRLVLEARGHDPAVLKSYKFFVLETARYLDVPVFKTWEPPKVHQRRTLLRSNFAKKKYLETYEARTYFQIMEFERLTGSTADTFLEYVERNLPEGVAMKVTKEEIRPLPEYLQHQPRQEES
ncbi:28S ribosomal protein S10, mitochondrial [Galendromus occidentalis]|uniref:Small ribosomal subunit protein uS10m n=1 Tax=Galendromus occidentalis TaxID=34638 RepID=A0AAJ6QSN4_9ACAR|nr:28S ribosomal protein S10, mitochondrial [Galendromus occidentalis]